MVTDKLRKYVLPNIPYVFIGWIFLKLGTAYRLAAGSDFAHKFIGLGQTVGAAFADFAPGLAPFRQHAEVRLRKCRVHGAVCAGAVCHHHPVQGLVQQRLREGGNTHGYYRS